MERYKEIERSIIKKYRKELWSRFVSAVSDYKLIEEGDKVAVCISGGKDSMLCAKLMQEIKVHGMFDFGLEFIVMDPGYREENRKKIEDNAKLLNIPIKIFETQIFDIVNNIPQNPCYLCARMRRGYLYRYAKELGCNKIALGHHFDDVIETTMMNIFYSGQLKSMMPKLYSSNFEGMQLIRPMYYIREDDIKDWCRYNDLQFIRCACRFTEEIEKEGQEKLSKRKETKDLIAKLAKENPYIAANIFNATHNVKLDTMVAWDFEGKHNTFLDYYDKV